MYKFFEDRHIKVSLFIQDKIQGLDGTIYLDFCGIGPKNSQKPGQVIFYDPVSSAQQRTKQITMMHSEKWEPYPYHNRTAMTTRPHLGANMYAENRAQPPIPWKPDTVEDQELEKIRVEKAKVEEEIAKTSKKEIVPEDDTNGATEEFNLLADLICAPEEEDNFKPMMFGDWLNQQTAGQGAKKADENTVDINLGEQPQDLSKVKKAA